MTPAARLLAAAPLLALALPFAAVQAAVTGTTSSTDFATATAGWTQQLTTFESESVGTSYAAGSGPAASGFTLSVNGGIDTPRVANVFWTTSGTHYLGLPTSDTAFYPGDAITFTFAAPVQAFALYAVTGGDTLAGDLKLQFGGTDVFNAASAATTDGHGSYAYFLGAVSSAGGFTSATLTGMAPVGSLVLFSVDDVVTATAPVPEPGTWLLLALGLPAIVAARRGRRS